MNSLTLGSAVRGFFEDFLQCQKGLRVSTIRSYRDCMRLYLLFVANDVPRKISRLRLEDLNADRVRRFLNNLEEERHNHIRSRNQRLSALRVFFEYLGRQNPELLREAERVAAIPTKRVSPPMTVYLEHEEIQSLFAGLPRSGGFALRDRALLLFLYNTGARVQETADLRVGNLELEPPLRVHLHGKGDKWRVCPLWEETATVLRQLIAERHKEVTTDHPVFISQRGQALTRYGIYKIVRRHSQGLQPDGLPQYKHVFPHAIRHSAAVHLLESGVDVNVIRGWLGHVTLEMYYKKYYTDRTN